MAKKMKSKGQHFGPQDSFKGKDLKKELANKNMKAGKEPSHSWDV